MQSLWGPILTTLATFWLVHITSVACLKVKNLVLVGIRFILGFRFGVWHLVVMVHVSVGTRVCNTSVSPHKYRNTNMCVCLCLASLHTWWHSAIFFSHPGPDKQQRLCFQHRWLAPCPPSPLSGSAATKGRNKAKLNLLHLTNKPFGEKQRKCQTVENSFKMGVDIFAHFYRIWYICCHFNLSELFYCCFGRTCYCLWTVKRALS